METKTEEDTHAGGNERSKNIARLIGQLLVEIGEDPRREGLIDTPQRVAETWDYFTQGYSQDIGELLAKAIVDDSHDGTVVVKDVDFYSLCEHHLVPFYGNCHISYIPDRKIIGLSKIARVVDMYSRRLQVQERLTNQIADALVDHLEPKGVIVLVEAKHLCMSMRGVEKHNTVVTTSAIRGKYEKDASLRAEFFAQLGNLKSG